MDGSTCPRQDEDKCCYKQSVLLSFDKMQYQHPKKYVDYISLIITL